MLFSAGLNVCGADINPEKARKRGLATVSMEQYSGDAISTAIKNQINTAVFPEQGGFDAIVFFEDDSNAALASALFESGERSRKMLDSLKPLVKAGEGKLVVQISNPPTAEVRTSESWELIHEETDSRWGVSRCVLRVS